MSSSLSYKEYTEIENRFKSIARREGRSIISQFERSLLIQEYSDKYLGLDVLIDSLPVFYIEPLLQGLEIQIKKELLLKKKQEEEEEKLKKNRKLKEYEIEEGI
jgi:hypothetical protein